MMADLSKIRKQFTQQGEAYKKLAYVRDDSGLKRVVALTRIQPHERVVDFACGPGYLTIAFAAASNHAVGIDATWSFLMGARAEASNRHQTNVAFVQGNVESTAFGNASFDVTVCRAAFHHFEDPSSVLAEMCRVTKPEGRLLVLDMLASEDRMQAAEHNRVERLCDPTHVRALSESEYRSLFDDSRLEVVYTGRGETAYTLDEWIDHGGPAAEAEREIRHIMAHSERHDTTGLRIWRVQGELHFCHRGAAFLLRKRPDDRTA